MKFIADKVRVTLEALHNYMHTSEISLSGFEYLPSGYKKDNTLPSKEENWQAIDENHRFQGKDSHYWVKANFKTPKADNENQQIVFSLITGKDGHWDALNPQCIVYLNGKMTQGMDINHTEVLLDFDKEYEIFIYFYVGMHDIAVEFIPSLKIISKPIERLYYNIKVPFDALECLDDNDENYIIMLKHLEGTCNILDLRQIGSDAFYKSIDDANLWIEEEFYQKVCGNSKAVVTCVGHTHIDVAWLWTLAQTREKTQRSFSTVVNLMKQYPEYKFMSSQPQLYKYLKEEAPDIYEEIKELVRQGRWEVEGAMWLEADCNLASGESLVRQVMFGKRFMQEEFNIDSKVLWLPDVFGYSAALPQILIKSGVDKFVTSKISWNEYNTLPYDTFMWEGIDGTDIFTQFITAQNYIKGETSNITTYNGNITPKQVLGAWKRYQQKHYNNETIITYGHGDGGGGPTKEMLENQRRLQYGLPGFPATQIDTATNFLARVQENFLSSAEFLRRQPRWVGELYLELHRGTYTSVAKNKKNNRISEFLCQTAETASVANMVLNGGEYPQNQLNESWETILTNQFHDIIPGSSIFEVYEDSDKDYKRVIETGQKCLDTALDTIADNLQTDGGVLVYNPNGFDASDVIDIDGEMTYVENIPAHGWRVVNPKAEESAIEVTKQTIESKHYKVAFDENYNMISLYDKLYNREVVEKYGKANQLQIFEDMPKFFDAWEITHYYKQKMWTIDNVSDVKILREKSRAGLRVTKTYGKSTIVQNIYLYDDIRRIDFETSADWHDEHILLKTAFPLNVHAPKATYDIQFGNLERPTHSNTSWDEARFEVCAHKWGDISEHDYGVSLLNDCKYGYSTEGNVIKLTLLKCATYPNPHADKGLHSFTYSLYPHGENVQNGGTIQESYLLNRPMIAKKVAPNEGKISDNYSLVSCDCENIMIETIKKAEDSDDVIVRLFDAYNKKSSACVNFGFDVKKAFICDLMENNIQELSVLDNSINLPIGNFEIVTVKVLK